MAAGSEEGRWKWIQERVKGIIEGKRYSRSRERCSIKEKRMATTTLVDNMEREVPVRIHTHLTFC